MPEPLIWNRQHCRSEQAGALQGACTMTQARSCVRAATRRWLTLQRAERQRTVVAVQRRGHRRIAPGPKASADAAHLLAVTAAPRTDPGGV